MGTLQIEKKNAMAAWLKADMNGREMLTNLFGKCIIANIMDRVNDFSDVCAEAGEDPRSYAIGPHTTPKQIGDIYEQKVALIVRVFNEGWKADYSDCNQKKYTILWNYVPGSGFSYRGYSYDLDSTFVGARLSFKSSEIAIHVAKKFKKEFNDHLTYTY